MELELRLLEKIQKNYYGYPDKSLVFLVCVTATALSENDKISANIGLLLRSLMIVIHNLGKRIIRTQVKMQTNNHSVKRKQVLVENISRLCFC